jgi:hypothetical protein
VDPRIKGDVNLLLKQFKLKVTAGKEPGHKALGEHGVGLAVDIVPDFARGGTWADVGKAAAFAKKRKDVFRWVGWNGDPGHGDPAHAGANAHLHLSWHGGPTEPNTPVKNILPDISKIEPQGGPLFGGPGLIGAVSKAVGIGKARNEVVDAAAGLAKDGAGAAAGAAADAAGGAIDFAKDPVGAIVEEIAKKGARPVLTVMLVFGGLGLAGVGVARMVGVRSPTAEDYARAIRQAQPS